MKKDEKGFTLSEVIAVILILGVIGSMAVLATTRYLNWSRNKAYETMQKSIYEAGVNCITEGGCQINGESITTETLQNYGYLEGLSDPGSKSNQCSGNVVFNYENDNDTTLNEFKSYTAKVTLNCSNYSKQKEFKPFDDNN